MCSQNSWRRGLLHNERKWYRMDHVAGRTCDRQVVGAGSRSLVHLDPQNGRTRACHCGGIPGRGSAGRQTAKAKRNCTCKPLERRDGDSIRLAASPYNLQRCWRSREREVPSRIDAQRHVRGMTQCCTSACNGERVTANRRARRS